MLRYSSNPYLGEQLKTVHLPIRGTRQNVVKSLWAHLRAQVVVIFESVLFEGLIFAVPQILLRNVRRTLEGLESWQVLYLSRTEMRCKGFCNLSSLNLNFCET